MNLIHSTKFLQTNSLPARCQESQENHIVKQFTLDLFMNASQPFLLAALAPENTERNFLFIKRSITRCKTQTI